jgi:hypothetical protein
VILSEVLNKWWFMEKLELQSGISISEIKMAMRFIWTGLYSEKLMMEKSC